MDRSEAGAAPRRQEATAGQGERVFPRAGDAPPAATRAEEEAAKNVAY